MKDKQWVQHISGQGEKWEVYFDDAGTSQWGVRVGTGIAQHYHWLPKSEYVPCASPERWVDVTAEVEVVDRGEYSNLVYRGDIVKTGKGPYRLRKIAIVGGLGHAFVVERKQ